MEADGKADTLEYKKLAAKIANNNKNLQNQADNLKTKPSRIANLFRFLQRARSQLVVKATPYLRQANP
jgi:hypothetical protein